MPSVSIRALCLLTLAVAAGCGGSTDEGTPRPQAAKPAECPPGTPELGIDDVLSRPPPGTFLVRPSEESLEQFRALMRAGANGAVGGIQASIVVGRGRETGTAVIVANANERTDDPREILRGAQDAERDSGVEAQPVTVAGRRAALVAGANGVIVTASVGTCGLVTLIDEREAPVRRVAARIRQPE